jgi:hypothetical protein
MALRRFRQRHCARKTAKRHKIGAGTLMLIEHGEKHEIKNTGRALLRTAELLRASRIYEKW